MAGPGPWRWSLWRVVVVSTLLVIALLGAMLLFRGPPPGPSTAPAASPTPADPAEVVVMSAGDIACDPAENETSSGECRQQHTAELVVAANPDAVLTVGDHQYDEATMEKLLAVYDPTWGPLKDKTRPVPGNHEYADPVGEGRAYFEYFGAAAGDPSEGYYTYELGAWQVYALNTVCAEAGGCEADSPQVRWLRAELAASEKTCALAYFHHPRWTTGAEHDDNPEIGPIIEALYDHGVELTLVGHDHNYQRFPPLDPAGTADPRGVRQFIVGTGGVNLYDLDADDDRAEARSRSFGVLQLRLRDDAYDWEFVPDPGGINGTFQDSGTGACHSASPASP